MTDKPILIFPAPGKVIPQPGKPSFVPDPHMPSRDRQKERLSPEFAQLQKNFERAVLQSSASGAEPEQVIVLETAGPVSEFFKAVSRIRGMEWLTEWDTEDAPPDEDFFNEQRPSANLTGRAFLIMSNQTALHSLLSLWQRFQSGEGAFGSGLSKFVQMFSLLRNVRTWGPEDRLREAKVVEHLRTVLDMKLQKIRMEIELWYRQSVERRTASLEALTKVLEQENGRIIAQCSLPEISYHSVLVELPPDAVERMLSVTQSRLVYFDQVMTFRAAGQIAAPREEPVDQVAKAQVPAVLEPPTRPDPVVALLDGMPLQNHINLAGRLLVDDPDGWEEKCPAESRQHGTSMASLIVHGDLNKPTTPLTSLLYVRPILLPEKDFDGNFLEFMPDNILGVDLVHRAVRRIFEGDAGLAKPIAPSVKIINFSIGDSSRPFDNAMSPLARLLDWLSHKYNVLFLISAGNHPVTLELDIASQEFKKLKPPQLESEVIKHLASNLHARRLLSPAESLNGITVGALHDDDSVGTSHPYNIDVYQTRKLPSPLNAVGLGFRRSVKPEIFLPGGRVLYAERASVSAKQTILEPVLSKREPGLLVSSPSKVSGDRSNLSYSRGSSNSTALASRQAAGYLDLIEELRKEPEGKLLSAEYTAVLLKAMLVHGAYWDDAATRFMNVLRNPSNSRKIREHLARFVGYGSPNNTRMLRAADHRATLVGCGKLMDDEIAEFQFPLPEDLGGKHCWRQLVLTLAWLTPINGMHRSYRGVALNFSPPMDQLLIKRKDVDWRAVQRGTVQHEVLIGSKATAFKRGDALSIHVECRAEAFEYSTQNGQLFHAKAGRCSMQEGRLVSWH